MGNYCPQKQQRELVDQLETDQGNIARLERSRTQATVRTLKRVAAARKVREGPERCRSGNVLVSK
jgi:hypothetical protein